MIKTTKKILPVLALALVMIIGMSSSVLAESSSYDGTCTFTGSKIVSSFDSAKVASMVSGLQPGDDVTFNVQYKNGYDASTDWYMENSIVQTLEKTTAAKKVSGTGTAEKGGYTYELTLFKSDGSKTVLFSNEEVGGDAKVNKMEGLEPATNALDDWFYIDTLKKGQSGKVVLHVAFDGETEVNDYMDTDGELNVRFAVELTPTGTKTTKAVKTGDQSDLLMWAAIGLVAGLLMLVLAFLSRKRDEKVQGKGGKA